MVCPDIGIAYFQSSKNMEKKTFLVDCHITQVNIIHLMYGPEGNSFVFPRVLMFPETKSRETSGLEGQQLEGQLTNLRDN